MQRPLYNLELMKNWAYQLYNVCRRRSVTAWSASLKHLRQHFNQAAPPRKEEIIRIVGKPRECYTHASLRGQRTRKTALSTDGQTKHGSIISVMPGIDKLLELALEAG